jgi:hypothetical protein
VERGSENLKRDHDNIDRSRKKNRKKVTACDNDSAFGALAKGGQVFQLTEIGR